VSRPPDEDIRDAAAWIEDNTVFASRLRVAAWLRSLVDRRPAAGPRARRANLAAEEARREFGGSAVWTGKR